MGALLAWMAVWFTPRGTILFRERSYFGVVRVVESPSRNVRSLLHGTTLHGAQLTDPQRRDVPVTYFSRQGPAGSAFRAGRPILQVEDSHPGLRVGVVGLGIGSLACYRVPGDRWTFFEIDPTVVRVATDTTLFTYLADCAPGAGIVLGDARLSLRRAVDRKFDLLVLDAFSSDAIPVHLLTRGALALYGSRLTDDGLLLVHLSNRYLQLRPVVARLSADGGWKVAFFDHRPSGGETVVARWTSRSIWAALTRSDTLIEVLRDSGWSPADEPTSGPLWTDSHTSLVEVLRPLR